MGSFFFIKYNMPTFKTAELLAILPEETQQIIQEVQQFEALSEEELRQEPAQKKWSMIYLTFLWK